MINHEVTTNEIMDFLAEHMVTKEEFNELKGEVNGLKGEFDQLKVTVATKEDLRRSEQTMMDFVTDRLADLRGDLVILMRKEDTKLIKLVDILKSKALLNSEEVQAIMSMEPFAKLFI